MAEQDLTRICQAIPVSTAGSVSTQAHNIMLGIDGSDVEFDINTGSSPTLFPAPLSTSLNKVTVGSTKTSSLNGGFADLVSVVAKVDGVEVQLINNEYIVQPSDDGKTFTINLQAADFLDGVSSVTLEYRDVTSFHRVAITVNKTGSTWADCAWGLRLDTSSVNSYYLTYLCGEILTNGSASNLVMPLGVIKVFTITAAAQMPLVGCYIEHDVTIYSGSSNYNPASVAYPISRFWFKGMKNSPTETWYDDKLGTIVSTNDLPNMSGGYGSYGTVSGTIDVTNARTLDTYSCTSTISQSQVGQSFNQSTTPTPTASDISMECLAGDVLIFDIDWNFVIAY